MSWRQRGTLVGILLVCFGIVGSICWWGVNTNDGLPDQQLDAVEPIRSDSPPETEQESRSPDVSVVSDSPLGDVMSDVGGRIKVRRGTHNPLPDECRELLSTYQEQENCVLMHAGYLDLLGRTWGCVVRGLDWVEVGVVREAVDETEGEVIVMRFEPEDITAESLRVLQNELTASEIRHGSPE